MGLNEQWGMREGELEAMGDSMEILDREMKSK